MSEETRQQLLGKEELTIREAAELWGVDIRRVWRYVKKGLIDGRNIAPTGSITAKWLVNAESLKKRAGIADKSPSELVSE